MLSWSKGEKRRSQVFSGWKYCGCVFLEKSSLSIQQSLETLLTSLPQRVALYILELVSFTEAGKEPYQAPSLLPYTNTSTGTTMLG